MNTLNIGDTVKVVSKGNKGKKYDKTVGKIGVVDRWIDNINDPSKRSYGVKFSDITNNDSQYGYFWFTGDCLEKCTRGKRAESTIIDQDCYMTSDYIKQLLESSPYGFIASAQSSKLKWIDYDYHEHPEKLYYKSTKENKNMFTITTTESYRIDKTNNTKIIRYTTRVQTSLGAAEVTCDEGDYNDYMGAKIAAAKITALKSEECRMMFNIAMDTWGEDVSESIINRFADRACYGNFEKVYDKWHKEQEHKSIVERTCKTCGKKFDTPEEARAHEKWHVDNKKAKHERYLVRYEAKRRLAEEKREKAIKDTMNAIVEKTNNVK